MTDIESEEQQLEFELVYSFMSFNSKIGALKHDY